ncbi:MULTISPECIES: hypothetical protein [unclassified Mycobacterium]|uniref:hypothetical protein n=1 Tax=unclassified Mycobacterium TaxID=2642494 RepID=UPI0006DCC27D|nr:MULTISPECIES: hypothetical protein [unclassified Mycobacterium]
MAVAITTAAVTVAACSTTKSTVVQPPASKPSSSAAAPSPQAGSSQAAAADRLDPSACVEITQANLDLATATNADAARKAGDAFEKYDLPGSVKEAVEHFVGTRGAQFDDPQYDKYNGAIEGWIKQVCPL